MLTLIGVGLVIFGAVSVAWGIYIIETEIIKNDRDRD